MSSFSNAATPLTARSVIASVLLGTDPPWLPTNRLVRTTALFGISEGTTRTALSRMVNAGEAVAQEGGYRLHGPLVARQVRQIASRRATTRAWDGTWELITINPAPPRPAADRAGLRHALRAHRLVEIGHDGWGRPDNLDPQRAPDAATIIQRWCTRWNGAHPIPPPRAEALFALKAWSRQARGLRSDMARALPRLEAGRPGALVAGFVTSAAVLRHLQADPLLPETLLPRHWPGVALRADYDRYDTAYRSQLREWFRAAL